MQLAFNDPSALDRAAAPAASPSSLAPGGAGAVAVAAPRRVGVDANGGLSWLDAAALAAAEATVTNDGRLRVPGVAEPLPLAFLGSDAATRAPRWALCLPTDAPPPASLRVAMLDLRAAAASSMPAADLGAAGTAAALAGWHASSSYCGRCGAPTLPVDAGTRRACAAGHKAYPRTDPVAIALVASPDGGAALLARPRGGSRYGATFMTSIAGFVEAGESVEAAVAREAKEETGVAVARAALVGSQAWPPGRSGCCELMLGCAAVASTTAITLCEAELEAAAWYPRADVAAALAGRGPFAPPPPWTMAGQLMRAWVDGEGVWSRL